MGSLKLVERVQVQPAYARRNEWERLARQEGLGFEALELFTPPVLGDAELTKRTVGWYRESGLAQSIHGAFMDVNISSSDQKIREISITRCRESCTCAHNIGAKRVVFHSNAYPYLDSDAYLEKWAGECAEAYLMLAQHFQLTVCVENCLDQNPKALKKLMEKAAGPNLQVCLDLGHTHYGPTPMEEWFDALGPYISYLHLSDNHGRMDEHLPLGAGTVDWAKADRLWRQLERPAVMTLEVGELDGVKQSLRYLRERQYFGFGGDLDD